MDVALLHHAGAGDGSHREDKLVKLLKSHGHKVRSAAIDEGIADAKLLKWAELVVAAGGDGTIRKTLTRMSGHRRPVGILPLGTANNIARSLGIGTDIAALVAGWTKGKPRKIDLGNATGPWGHTQFVEGIGLGIVGRTMAILNAFDARVVHPFSSTGDKLHRDIAVLTALASEMPPVRARIKVAGERVKDDFLLLEILNISRAGPGVVLAADAKPDDGELNLITVSGDERRNLISELEKHAAGQHDGTRFHDRPVKKLRLEVGPCELRVDDKICLVPADFRKYRDQRARIDVSVEPGAVRVFC